MRHGQAVDAYSVASDAERRLTELGRRQSVAIAKALGARALAPTHVYASPFVRAVETAEAVTGALGLTGPVRPHAPLVPGHAGPKALSILDAHGPSDRVLLVSHEPTVRVLGGMLGRLELPPFPTSGVAVFDVDAHPRFLGRLDPELGWRGPDDLGF